MSEVRQDSLTPLRLWARGFWSGYASAASSESGALKAEAKLMLAWHKLNLPAEDLQHALEHAYLMVEHYCPEPRDPYFVRWMGAELAASTLLDLCSR